MERAPNDSKGAWFKCCLARWRLGVLVMALLAASAGLVPTTGAELSLSTGTIVFATGPIGFATGPVGFATGPIVFPVTRAAEPVKQSSQEVRFQLTADVL